MTGPAETVHLATWVPKDLADEMRDLAKASERSTAAEIRLAVKAWVDSQQEEKAA